MPSPSTVDTRPVTTLVYSGNLGLGHQLETIVRAVHKLSSDLALRVLFVGEGKSKEPLKKLSAGLGLDCVEFRPPVPLDGLPALLAAGDIHLVSQKPGTQGLIVPSKLYGVLAAGRPTLFVGPEDCEVAMILRASGSGVVVPPSDVEAVVDGLRNLVQEPDLRRQMGRRARECYEQNFGRDRSVAAIAEVIEEAVKNRNTQPDRARTEFSHRWFWLMAACLLTAMLLVLSHLPQGMVPADLGTGIGDKLPHALAAGLLTLIWVRALGPNGIWRSVGVAFLVVVFIVTLDEITQPLVGRSCTADDWLADLTGAVLALAILGASVPFCGRKREGE